MKTIIGTLSLLLLTVFLNTGCQNNQKQKETQVQEVAPSPEATAKQLADRGDYLVTICGCHDCHSPKQMGPKGPELVMDRLLSGYPADRPVVKGDPKMLKQGFILFSPDLTSSSGPWGVSFSANLTSDQSGIGNWTLDNFKRALRQGKFKGLEGSRELLPPMPWQNFAKMTDEDTEAIFAFLQTTKPVSNVVPAAIINEVPGNKAISK